MLGIATGAAMGVLGDAWLMASIVLTGAATGILLALVLPGQEELLAAPDQVAHATTPAQDQTAHATTPVPDQAAHASTTSVPDPAELRTRRAAATRLAMTTGIFNLLWAAVVVLMVVRPGSTTGA